MKNPWMKFYPSDWRADPALRMCSLAARGLWVEMMALMHEADPYGHLVVRGKIPTEAQIAMLVGASADEVEILIGELEAAGVFSRSRNGSMYSRRMTRDEKKRKDGEKTAKNGTLPSSRRGRKPIENKEENSPPPGVVEGVVSNPPPHPEARSQKPEARNQTIPPTPLPAEPRPKSPSAVEIGFECLAIIGADATPWEMGSKNFSQVHGWLGAGYTVEEITGVFNANKDRLAGKDNPLAYAAKILPDAIEARRLAAKASEERASNPADWQQINGRPISAWRTMRDAWLRDGFWAPHWGLAPDQPGTLCPVGALNEESENDR